MQTSNTCKANSCTFGFECLSRRRRDFDAARGGTEADLIKSANWRERDKSTGAEEGSRSEVVLSTRWECGQYRGRERGDVNSSSRRVGSNQEGELT